MMVGMVNINCPACGELLAVDVRVKSVSSKGDSFLIVTYQNEAPEHRCAGRR